MVAYHYQRTTAFEADQVQDSESSQQLGLEAQAVRRYCDRAGLGAATLREDRAVAWSLDFAQRPVAAALLEQLRAGDVLIASSIERIFSSCQDTLNTLWRLRERGVGLHILELAAADVCESRFSSSFVELLEIFAGIERRRGAERIRRIKQEQRERGRFLGGSRPFGYMIHDNGRLLENPLEQRVLKRILQLNQQGKSLRAIAAEVSTPMAPISFKTVQRILQRQDAGAAAADMRRLEHV